MNFQDSIRVAIEGLAANKLRACLTMLGIVIGVASVIALMAVGQGSQKAVTDKISGLGSNLIFIRPGSSSSGGVRLGAGTTQTLTVEDAEAIAGVSGVTVAAPQLNAGAQVIAGGNNTFTQIVGLTPSYLDATQMAVESGAFFSQDDVDHATRVAVLGANVAQQLFATGNDPVGQQMRINVGRNVITLQIVGVLKAVGGNAQSSSDNQVIVPLTTVQKQISAQRNARAGNVVSQITIQVADKGQINATKQAISDLLLTRHKTPSPDFTVESQADLEAAAAQVSQTMTMLLGAIAGISLLVGGIGIMNIMLVSVTERTREIGIRKAVGARNSDIMRQFLTESLTVTVTGGLLGIALGLGAAEGLNGRNISGLGDNIQTVISWTSVGAAFAVSAAIGLFFGLYPASRASNLRPIEALHYD